MERTSHICVVHVHTLYMYILCTCTYFVHVHVCTTLTNKEDRKEDACWNGQGHSNDSEQKLVK